MRVRNNDLFERLGGWVADTPDPALQRLFAEACHRHAWHAELWAERTPAIPTAELGEPATATPVDSTPPAEQAAAYQGDLDRMLGDLRALLDRVDAVLDPSTVRTTSLVVADLTDIDGRLGMILRPTSSRPGL